MLGRNFLLGLFVTILLSGCGGSGSKGDELEFTEIDHAEYTGKTEFAAVDVSNAKKLAYYMTLTIDLVELLSTFNGENLNYTHTLTGGDFTDDSEENDSCLTSGSLQITEQYNERNEGRIQYIFDHCRDEDFSIDGTVIVDGRWTSADTFGVTVSLGEVVFNNFENDQLVEYLAISGTIDTFFDEYGAIKSNQVWNGNLVIGTSDAGLQLKVEDLIRIGRGNDYSVTGKLYLSDSGYVNLHLDATQKQMDISGSQSVLRMLYELDQAAGNGTFYPVSKFYIGLNSQKSSIPLQTIAITPEALEKSYLLSGLAPAILWNDVTAVRNGTTASFEPSVSDSDSFLEYIWSVESYSNECPLNTLNQTLNFSISSDCYGDVKLNLSVFDGVKYYEHDYFLRIKKDPALVTFEQWNSVANINTTFNLSSTIENLEDGPFSYTLSYGLPDPTLSNEGVFHWSFDFDYPNLFSEMQFHYGAAVTNDDTVVKDIEVTVDFDEGEPTAFTPYLPAEGSPYWTWYTGGTDMEPNNPQGDIAFVAVNFYEEQLVKFNKGSRELRVVTSLPTLDEVENGSDFNLRAYYHDWNGDGVDDLIYSQSLSDGGISTTRLIVFDMKTEQIIYQQPLFTTQYRDSPIYPHMVNMHAFDVDNDGVQELFFGFEGSQQSTSLLDGATITPGIFLFDPNGSELHQLHEPFGETVFADLDGNGTLEMLDYQYPSISRYSLDGSTKTFVKQGELSIQDIQEGSEKRHLVSMQLRDTDHDGTLEVLMLFVGDEIACRLEELRARIEQNPIAGLTGMEGISTSCISAYLALDDHLNIVGNRLLDFLPSRRASFARVINTVDTGSLLMTSFNRQDNGLGMVNFDMNSGGIVWSKSFASGENWQAQAAVEFVDSSGARQMAVGRLDGIIVTQ